VTTSKNDSLTLHLFQKEVAKRLRATTCTYRNWEKNRSNPSLPFTPRIIQSLGYVPYGTQTQDFGKKIATSRGFLA
jgi:DNA-binding XRE family transcriptional regulator